MWFSHSQKFSPRDYCPLPLLPSPTSVFRHQCSDCSALHQTVHRIKDFSERKSNKRACWIGKAPSQHLYHELSNLPPFHLFWKEIHTLERFWVTASVYYEMYINFSQPETLQMIDWKESKVNCLTQDY